MFFLRSLLSHSTPRSTPKLTHTQPITEVTSNDIVCNGGPNPTKATSKVITVQAGSQATLHWRHTLQSGPDNIIDSSHKGPVMAYMKKVSDATKDSGVGGTFFAFLPMSLFFTLCYITERL